MATPDFVLRLREQVGTAPLPLVGVTAVVFRDEKVLVGRRADNGALQCVSGIVDPGEEPADAAVRECLEEAGVVVRADRLALVQQIPRITHANGDLATYLDLTFACTWVQGEAHVADDESRAVGWYGLDGLPPMSDVMLERIAAATSDEREARFLDPLDEVDP